MGRVKQILGTAQVGNLFNVNVEAQKAIEILEQAPSKWPLKSNDQDLKAMGFKDADMGFFMLFIKTHKPGIPAFKVLDGEERAATELLRKLNVRQFKDDLWLATTGCTWDIAKQRYKEADVLECRAVVFSTPSQLMILSETP